MIRKIFNWVGSGFFRGFGRILVYILIGILLSFLVKKLDIKSIWSVLYAPINVYAETNGGPFYQYGVEGISELYAYNWSSYPSSYTSKTVIANYTETENPYLSAFYVPSVNIATQGVSIVYSPNQRLVEGYLYSIGTIVCFDTSLNSIYSYSGQSSMGGNASTALTATPTYQFTTRVRVAEEDSLNCIMYQSLIVPQTTGSFYALRMTNSSGYQANMVVWATKVEELGIYTTTIQSMLSSAIQSSGLATASSVSQVQSAVNEVQQEVSNVNDTLTDDDTDESIDEASDFFSNFSTNTHGLTGIITAPLSAIQSLSSSSCTPLVLPLPFVNDNITLPCMRQIYDQHFGTFMQIYDVITLGIVAYWVCVRIFGLVKDFKNPEHDEIEVVDL